MSTEPEYGGGMLTALFQSLWSALDVCLFVHEALCSGTGGIGTRNNSVGIERAFMRFGFGICSLQNIRETPLPFLVKTVFLIKIII
jgi:hypothetical protein